MGLPLFLFSDARQHFPGPLRILRTNGEVIGVAVDLAIGAEIPVVQLGTAAADGHLRVVKARLHDLDARILQRPLGGLPVGASPQTSNIFSRFPNRAMSQSSRDFQAVSRAISIISWKESCRSWALRASPVKMWSEMVRMARAFFPSRWAVQ